MFKFSNHNLISSVNEWYSLFFYILNIRPLYYVSLAKTNLIKHGTYIILMYHGRFSIYLYKFLKQVLYIFLLKH